MNTDKTFEFYLKKDDTTYFAVQNGVVVETTQKTPLQYSPADWDDTQVASKISGQEWVATREYTEPLKFVLDGAKIIRHIMYTQGFTGICIMLIEKLNTFDRQYYKWYQGNLDISYCEDEDDYVNANILETDLIGLLRNREDVPYEIDLSSGLTLRLDGVKLGAKASWILGDSLSGGTYEGPASTHGPKEWYLYNIYNGSIEVANMGFLPATSYGNNVQAGSFIEPRDATYSDDDFSPISGGPSGVPINLTNPQKRVNTILRTAANWYNVKITGKISIGCSWVQNSGPINVTRFKIHVFIGTCHPDGARVNTLQIGESDWLNEGSTFSYPYIDLNGEISEIDNDLDMFLYLWLEGDPAPGDSDIGDFQAQYFIDGSWLQLNYQAKVQNTDTKVIRYIDFMQSLVSKITDGKYTCQSDFLSNQDTSSQTRFANFDNSPYNTVVTSGSGLRALSDAKIKTTFTDAMKDVWSRWGLVWAIMDGLVRIEPLSFFYANNELFHFDRLANLKTSFWRDRIFNQVNAGYKSYDNDTVDGLNEFNTGLTFMANDNTVIKATDDMVCPYRSDVYGIESIRGQTVDDDTKDNDFDNDIFVIEIDPNIIIQPPPFQDYYVVYRPTPIAISGVDDPQDIYNLTLSPKRAMLRHLSRLRSLIDTGELTYQTIDKNPSLACNLGAGNVVEIDNIDLSLNSFIGHSFPLIFKPLVIEFDAPAPYNLSEVLDTNQAGYISFAYNDTVFKGFILDVGCKPATRDKYTFRLLSHPDNDLSKLR